MIPPSSAILPHFAVDLAAPDISPWLAGPHVVITGVMHGNELAGAIVLDAMLRESISLARGRLTLGFANLDAFSRFDPAHPTASRFVDEDLNRLWDPGLLDGPRRSSELERGRAMRPLIDTADVLLDLHSMLWPSDPLILSGPTDKGRALGREIGEPGLVVSDHGHISGPRLIDYLPFTGPGPSAAVLVEAGQHWEPQTVACARACVRGLLDATGLVPVVRERGAVRMAEVTVAVTAATSAFAFLRPFRGGEVIADRNTLIALDGTTEIRTPHDDCVLIMPSLRPSRGHTAVRLARFV
jgi:predicted deacylase